ncbi:MAG: gliding motility-associated protein GldE [Flavobacteriales bacterium]|jgi:gliding motility-associated protein GldE|nr:gliding motility-associated protein GldE [Flavobacteriales bacterium]
MEVAQRFTFDVILSIFNPITGEVLVVLILMLVFIVMSALISGSEVAYFSISSKDKTDLESEKDKGGVRVLSLLERPKKLLATILIANNFINVAIVMFSTYVMNEVLNEEALSKELKFGIQVILVTFIILLLGEVMPKVYATRYKLKLAKIMSSPLVVIQGMVGGLSNLLVASTSIIDKRIKKKRENISVDDLGYALDLTGGISNNKEEKKILEGIVKFGQTDVKQIMTPRMDVKAIEYDSNYKEVLASVLEAKYSRIPVYEDTFDTIKGVLYIKDLLPYLEEKEFFDWKRLVREAKFVPENKKLDDLLRDFQEQKRHIAIVVDEYGGSSGIVTLEDILEEIVGDITDEFDDDDVVFSKLDEHVYVFEGKTALMDVYRVLSIDGEEFENAKGEADTIAGFCIEQAGKILLKNERIQFRNYTFVIEAADKRRIKQVKIIIDQTKEDE